MEYRLLSQQLSAEADSLEQQAFELDRHPQAHDTGSAQGVDVDALIAAVLSKPEIMGPGISVIREWAAHQPAKGRLVLNWRNGRIVQAR